VAFWLRKRKRRKLILNGVLGLVEVGFCWWCDGSRAGCFPVGFGLWLGLVVASKGENKDGVLVVNRLLFADCLVGEGTEVLVLFVSWSDKKRKEKMGVYWW